MTNYLKIQLLPFENNEDDERTPLIIISTDLMKQTYTNNPQKITLKSGQNTIDCFFKLSSTESKQCIYCSKVIFEKLFLPESPTDLYVKINLNDHIWEFGPFIGIVTDQIKNKHFGTIDTFIKELHSYAKQKNFFLYVFNYPNFHKDYVDGHWFKVADSSWETLKLPTPHVIHNRIHSRLNEKSNEAQLFFKQLEAANIPCFNERFLNKWEIYKILSSHDHLLPYIPETKLLNGRASIEEMANIHDALFLKPVQGSQGKNIFRIKEAEEGFSLDYTTFSGEVAKQYPSIQTLYSVIRPQLKKQRYIIQQGLKLLTYDERPLDFRLLCHRKNENLWVVTSSLARVSSKTEFVSNIARGGEIFKVNTILMNHFEKKLANQIRQLLYEIAIEIATSIHQNAIGVYGELGIDLAIDENGKPWIIEVNTKPSKNHDPEQISSKIRPSAKAVIDYCHRLTNWKI